MTVVEKYAITDPECYYQDAIPDWTIVTVREINDGTTDDVHWEIADAWGRTASVPVGSLSVFGEDVLELDYRHEAGLQVWLLWWRATNRTSVVVYDALESKTVKFDVSPQAAREAFIHPYAYAR